MRYGAASVPCGIRKPCDARRPSCRRVSVSEHGVSTIVFWDKQNESSLTSHLIGIPAAKNHFGITIFVRINQLRRPCCLAEAFRVQGASRTDSELVVPTLENEEAGLSSLCVDCLLQRSPDLRRCRQPEPSLTSHAHTYWQPVAPAPMSEDSKSS